MFGVCAVTFCVVGRRTNEIGLHASELWTNVVARGKASDDLLGRDLASALIDLPILLIALLAIAIDRDEWPYVVPALIFGCCALLATYAGLRIFNITFARGAAPIEGHPGAPQRQDPILNLLAMLTWVIVTAPVFAAAALVPLGPMWLILALPVAAAYGIGLWVFSLRWMGRWLDHHEAELLVRIQAG